MNTGPQGWHQGRALSRPAEELRRAWPLRPAVARPLPTTVLWRWRYEAVAIVGAPLVWWGAGGPVGLSVVAALLAAVGVVPPLRRWALAMVWTVVTPHRIRVGCAEGGVVSARGKLPTVLFTLRKPYGERVYLWCPDELGPADVAAARPAIAAACWVKDVQFYETGGLYPQLVAVDVIRLAVAGSEPPAMSALWRRFARHDGRFEGFAPLD